MDALNKAKRLGMTDEDSLLQAFLKWEGGELSGNATGIVKQLDPDNTKIEHMGGGQKIARRLREVMPTLRIASWDVFEGKAHGTAVFRFNRPKSQ